MKHSSLHKKKVNSDTISLSLYNKSVKQNDDTRSLCLKAKNTKPVQPNKTSKTIKSLSSSQSKLTKQSNLNQSSKTTIKPKQQTPSKPPIQSKPTIKQNNIPKNNKTSEQKINNVLELDSKNQGLNINKSITIKNPQNIDNYTEYNNSYIECVNDTSRYIIKPEYLTFQKSTENKSYYGIDQIKLSLIDSNQNTISSTIINPTLITTKEINLYNGTIECNPKKENDIVNKKYVDEKINDTEKINKNINKLAEQMNTNIDAINLIQKRLITLRDGVSTNLKNLNNKINNKQDIKNEIKKEIKNEMKNTSETKINEIKNEIINEISIKPITFNEITVNKLIVPESIDHIKFNSYIDCPNISLHNIECMNKNNENDNLNIKLDNNYHIHIYDDMNNNFNFNPYKGIIETNNGLTIQQYGEKDENATRITSEDITTKRIIMSNVDDNGEETVIIIQPANCDGIPKLQIAMRCGENEEFIYLP